MPSSVRIANKKFCADTWKIEDGITYKNEVSTLITLLTWLNSTVWPKRMYVVLTILSGGESPMTKIKTWIKTPWMNSNRLMMSHKKVYSKTHKLNLMHVLLSGTTAHLAFLLVMKCLILDRRIYTVQASLLNMTPKWPFKSRRLVKKYLLSPLTKTLVTSKCSNKNWKI